MATAIKTAALIRRLERHGGGVYSLELEPERRVPRYKAGQFLHLALDGYDPSRHWPESRAFSIASAPGSGVVRITYSVVGQFTRRLEAEAAEGKTVWIKLPYGEFVVEDGRETVLVAGGTGITAFTAYLEGMSEGMRGGMSGAAVHVLYGARRAELLVYRERIEGWRRGNERLQVMYFAEEGVCGEGIREGRLRCEDVYGAAARPEEAVFYLSGPPGMLKAFSEELRNRYGVEAWRIRIDAWE